ncbi:hypothetical protein [Bradyrhizobium neotropicale]|uniref:hypothetical protein n=1 Tax=Bradyrhizobium neotropicale TaxID=1497615 RepID=UPI001AD65D74|nr:hypothetical protein [Bradyrhizobium neotropicale]MBO4227883.1 hypothetical protein [Bradyrhizobium neotropicale]
MELATADDRKAGGAGQGQSAFFAPEMANKGLFCAIFLVESRLRAASGYLYPDEIIDRLIPKVGP